MSRAVVSHLSCGPWGSEVHDTKGRERAMASPRDSAAAESRGQSSLSGEESGPTVEIFAGDTSGATGPTAQIHYWKHIRAHASVIRWVVFPAAVRHW